MLEWILTAFVIAGALPLLAGCYQFVLAGLHRFRHREHGTLEREPNVAVVVPAWNEAAVIGRTIDTLLALDYPAERLRVYVVDDASTDETPDVVLGKAAEHPGPRLPPAPRQGRRGQGAHAQPRAARRSAPRAGTRRC